MYLITNGIIIQPEGLLEGHEVLICDDKISEIVPEGTTQKSADLGVIDAHGGYIMPGLIDIHSDYLENVASPRPTVVMDLPTSIFETERELLTHGVTTIFHSLSVYKENLMDVKAIRKFENVQKLIDLIDLIKRTEGKNAHLIRHRLHARLEIDNVHLVDQISQLITHGKVDLLSFMDHTPGQGQYRDLEVYAKTMRSYDSKLSDEDIERLAKKQQDAAKLSIDDLRHIADLAKECGIAIASHDDDSTAKLDLMQELGATISEFPIDLEVAQSAVDRGMYTVMGAPNILLGKSHSGNLSAREAVDAGVARVLCSDYYPTALLHSMFALHREHNLSLAEACKLMTINPARAARVDDELGSIECGKKADILIVREVEEQDRRFPVITAAMVDGRVVSRSWYPSLPSRSARFAYDAQAMTEELVD